MHDELTRLTVLTGLVFIVTQSTVKRCEFAELVTFQFVLTFGD